MKSPLPTLLGKNSASLVKVSKEAMSCGQDGVPMLSVDSKASVARSIVTNEDLSFEELFERVQSDSLDNICIQASELTESQRTSLILRGTRLRTVLAGFGKYLKNNRASESTFEFSEPVQYIDDFLSYAWATDRWLKTFALLYRYNFHIAVAAYSVTAAFAFVACWYIQQRFSEMGGEASFKVVSALGMMLIPTILFLVVFAFGINRFGHGGPVVFFDKICIHQSNDDLKRLAINGLETFVRKSKSLVLLYDGMTYERLWCAFETAMFAHDQEYSTSDIQFVPIATTVLVYLITVMNMIIPLLFLPIIDILVEEPADAFFAPFTPRVALANFLAWGFCPAILPDVHRKRSEDTQKLSHSLTNFSVRATKCSDENDRLTVNDRIVETWGSLADFDTFMRKDVRRRVIEMMYDCPVVGVRNLVPLAVPDVTFILWMGLNSQGYSMIEITLGAFVHGFVLRPINILCGDRFAEGVCRFVPVKARWLRTALISLLVCASWLLHNFVHCSIWVWSYETSDSYGWREAGCFMFLPFLLCEVCLLLRFHFISKGGDGTTFGRWTLADILYFAFWTGLALMIAWEASLNESQHE